MNTIDLNVVGTIDGSYPESDVRFQQEGISLNVSVHRVTGEDRLEGDKNNLLHAMFVNVTVHDHTMAFLEKHALRDDRIEANHWSLHLDSIEDEDVRLQAFSLSMQVFIENYMSILQKSFLTKVSPTLDPMKDPVPEDQIYM